MVVDNTSATDAEKITLNRAITLLDSKIAAAQPLAGGDEEAKAELIDLTARRKDKCKQATLLKSPSERVKIIAHALKTHQTALKKAKMTLWNVASKDPE